VNHEQTAADGSSLDNPPHSNEAGHKKVESAADPSKERDFPIVGLWQTTQHSPL